jgi:hypothetical protein
MGQVGFPCEEPETSIFRRLLPPFIVLCAGAMALSLGVFVRSHMIENVGGMNLSKANPSLLQKTVINDDGSELMVPQAPLPPQYVVVPVKVVPVKKVKKVNVAPQASTGPAAQPPQSPLQDETIPFQPAEDFPPGVEQNHPAAAEPISTGDAPDAPSPPVQQE